MPRDYLFQQQKKNYNFLSTKNFIWYFYFVFTFESKTTLLLYQKISINQLRLSFSFQKFLFKYQSSLATNNS